MYIKLFKRSLSHFEIRYSKHVDCIIFPSIGRPVFRNVKKEKGDGWNKNEHVHWCWSIYWQWLCFLFEIKIRK